MSLCAALSPNYSGARGAASPVGLYAQPLHQRDFTYLLTYAAKKYLPPPSKMSGVTFHFFSFFSTFSFSLSLSLPSDVVNLIYCFRIQIQKSGAKEESF